MRALLSLPLVVAAMVAAPIGSAAAEEAPAGTAARDEARGLAERGLERLDAGDARAAVDLFERAEAKFHAPTHLLYLARARAMLGDLPAAARAYDELVTEGIPNYAPDAFREAQRLGREELQGLRPKLGLLRFAGAGAAAVFVGHDRVSGERWYVHPGSHDVTQGEGAGARRQTVVVRAGAEVVIEIERKEAVDRAGTGPGGLTPMLVAGVVSVSVAGALATAGAVTGGLSFARVGELSDRCPTKRRCDAEAAALADDARALGDASTVLLVLGGVVGVTGVILTVLGDAPAPARGARPVAVTASFGLAAAKLRLTY